MPWRFPSKLWPYTLCVGLMSVYASEQRPILAAFFGLLALGSVFALLREYEKLREAVLTQAEVIETQARTLAVADEIDAARVETIELKDRLIKTLEERLALADAKAEQSQDRSIVQCATPVENP